MSMFDLTYIHQQLLIFRELFAEYPDCLKYQMLVELYEKKLESIPT